MTAPFPVRETAAFPPAEAAAVSAAFAGAEVILEYGAGGSTRMAAAMPGKVVYSVESDPDWIQHVAQELEGCAAQVVLHHADIGPTRAWGYPAQPGRMASWPGYALSIWDRPDFRHPEVVLIDGRFRPACILTTLFRIARPVTVLWDDYTDRALYHFVEDFCPKTDSVGRMAIFTAQPMAVPADQLGLIISTFLRPQ